MNESINQDEKKKMKLKNQKPKPQVMCKYENCGKWYASETSLRQH